ncbi:AAA family ATPase [Methylobacterium trifolii]|uniref:Iron-sulfur cluster carrier protein n=1 Tax=Methylobacterium trifolii TaxID=1003092 RepID=A0ABQ4U3M6_9HYPH|nr:AAA family ATPase [Methylobacterium trifolii]GJE62068.1 Iron-sulfur cluster carrier protein [Methylobacterium trifolii]
MILMVGNTKGGVGKTTLAVQLAIGRARQGRQVWLVDADTQGTASMSIAERTLGPGIACSSYIEPKTLRSQVKQQLAGYDDVVIDVGGRDNGVLRTALMLTDVALVPFAPMSFDLWAMHNMAKAVSDVNGERDGLRVFAVMNQAEPRENSVDNAEAASAVREIPEFEYLDLPIRKRKAFSVASSQGMGVHETTPPDPKAVAELDRLLAAVFVLEEV